MEQKVKVLHEALELTQALDKPFNEGLEILEAAGFDYSNRFELSASDFVKGKVEEALGATE